MIFIPETRAVNSTDQPLQSFDARTRPLSGLIEGRWFSSTRLAKQRDLTKRAALNYVKIVQSLYPATPELPKFAAMLLCLIAVSNLKPLK